MFLLVAKRLLGALPNLFGIVLITFGITVMAQLVGLA